MRREPAAFLWDVHEAALRIHEFVIGHDFEKFAASVLVQSAPDCDQIIAFRNILIHGYAVLDIAIVWKVIQQHLPVMEEAVMRLLDAEPPPDVASTN